MSFIVTLYQSLSERAYHVLNQDDPVPVCMVKYHRTDKLQIYSVINVVACDDLYLKHLEVGTEKFTIMLNRIKFFSSLTCALRSRAVQARALSLPPTVKAARLIAVAPWRNHPTFEHHVPVARYLTYGKQASPNFWQAIKFCLCYLDAQQHTQFVDSVKGELKSGDGYVKDRQMSFLSSITNEVSDLTAQLLAKLNCEANCELWMQ